MIEFIYGAACEPLRLQKSRSESPHIYGRIPNGFLFLFSEPGSQTFRFIQVNQEV